MVILPDIQEIDMTWLEQGPLGKLPVARVFVADDNEYAVHLVRPGIYTVMKYDGKALEQYDVQRGGRVGWTCSCRSGRQHRECRHKEMVQRVDGSLRLR